ncbi:MAG: transglutaminase-like domain-containing protein [Ignavibacteria bacterium]|nr:transglutaminase-like domain-containing protein [Ignavibacteria bacterium]
MITPEKLPFLIELLDDPSAEIRSTVLRELELFGSDLESELKNRDIKLDEEQRLLLQSIFSRNDRKWLQEIWDSVFEIEDELIQLETGLGFIADFQNGRSHRNLLSGKLDKLAAEFLEACPAPDHFKLIQYLFRQNIKGAEDDYYNPLNSNLTFVIDEKRGIPISLVCILILTGKRVGLEFQGCNFPGHFLGQFYNPANDETVLVDCFNGGQLIYEEDLEDLQAESLKSLIEATNTPTTARSILLRVLGNLIFAYRKSNDILHSEFFEALLHVS